MKTNLVRMAVLVSTAVTMAAPAFAGQGARVITPDPNDWQYREAMETGSLPSGQDVLKVASGPAAEVPTVEYGGIAYRVDIDTP